MDVTPEINFCRRCGGSLSHTNIEFWDCPNGHSTFNNPAPTVGIFFLTPYKKVVLARRGIDPGKGMLDSIGGFVEAGESVEEAAHREIAEETGLTRSQYGPLTYFRSAPAAYHYQDEDRPVVTSFFWSTIDENAQLTPGDDVAEIITLPLYEVNPDELSSDDVRKVLKFLEENL